VLKFTPRCDIFPGGDRFGVVPNSTDRDEDHRLLRSSAAAAGWQSGCTRSVSVPATIDICQSILAPGGRRANGGVYGKPVTLHLEKLWDRNITLTTRLVDTVTTPMLLR
jgi:threonine dehydrogenase-like Zn-dependent dehydrogenase